MVDHVHFEHKNLRAGWANVHAYVNGQLVSGQLRLVRKPEPLPSQPDVSAITDVFNDAIDEVYVARQLLFFKCFLLSAPKKVPGMLADLWRVGSLSGLCAGAGARGDYFFDHHLLHPLHIKHDT